MPSSTSIAQVRRLIYGGSTRSGSLSTGDIGWFVDNAANVYLAAEQAALAEAAADFGNVTNMSVGDLSVGRSADYLRWRELAARLHRQGIRSVSVYAGGISQSDKETQRADTDWDKPANRLGQFDYEAPEYDT